MVMIRDARRTSALPLKQIQRVSECQTAILQVTYSLTTATTHVTSREMVAKRYSFENGWYFIRLVWHSWIRIVLCTITKMKKREYVMKYFCP